jgi:hypothetical protein
MIQKHEQKEIKRMFSQQSYARIHLYNHAPLAALYTALVLARSSYG